eukprot:jgi/Psemu1/321607/estExt_fgenesh1_pg.C_60007
MTRAQLTDPAYYESGWDHPPEVASLGCGHRGCHWKTSQRLFSLDCHKESPGSQEHDERPASNYSDAGSMVCAPIVLYRRYILVASGMNLVVFGTFDTEDSFDQSIQRRIDTTATAPLAEFSLCSDAETPAPEWNDKIIQLSFHEETSILYALSMESCIFQVKIAIDVSASAATSSVGIGIGTGTPHSDLQSAKQSASDGSVGESAAAAAAAAADGASRRPPEFSLIHHWVSESLGATCMATLYCGGGTGTDTICVGYKTGHIEAWNVLHTLSPRTKPSGHWGAHQRRPTIPKKDFSLQWEGYLHDSIRTLSFLARDTELPKEALPEGSSSTVGYAKAKTSPNKNSKASGTAKEHFLIAVVAISTRNAEKRKQPPTSSMLKILDLERITNGTRRTTDSSTGDAEMELQNYALPPSRGAEVMDATNLLPPSKDYRLPKRVPVLESHGADAACHLKTGSVGVAFPDGIIALLSGGSSDEFGVPGVANCDQQVLLSYPAIGSGQLDAKDANGNSSTYLVACLRGGTCYMIPAAGDNHHSIATIPFPHDMELDFSDVYVQSFTAGNLVVDRVLLPVLIYAWPGGIVDVYSCGLIAPSKPSERQESTKLENDSDTMLMRAEKRTLRDLIDNDSLVLLSKIVDELRADSRHPLLQQKEWQEFLAEAKRGNALHNTIETLSLDTLCSTQYESLHRVLLSLALVSE